jgi:hypothetical protein
MTTGLYKKGLVLVIICLFIGASVVPTISGNIVIKKDTDNIDYMDVLSSLPDDELDQYQDISDGSFATLSEHPNWAQSFKPSLNVLTRVELWCSGTVGVTGNFVVSIRDDLYGEDLRMTSKHFEGGWSWREFDFQDLQVVPGKDYFIVIGCDKYESFVYAIKAHGTEDLYLPGKPYRKAGDEWVLYDPPCKDFCFKTYGPGSDEPEIEITGIYGGFRVSADIINNGTATAYNVNWSIDLDGGLIFAGEHTEGVIPELAPGATVTIRQTTLYGIGNTVITVTAGDATKQATGFILGPLVLNVQEI